MGKMGMMVGCRGEEGGGVVMGEWVREGIWWKGMVGGGVGVNGGGGGM